MIFRGHGEPGCFEDRPVARLRNRITGLERRLKAKEGEVRNIQHELKALRSLLEKVYAMRAIGADDADTGRSEFGGSVLGG